MSVSTTASVKTEQVHFDNGCNNILLDTELATDVNKYSLTIATYQQRWQTNCIYFYVESKGQWDISY